MRAINPQGIFSRSWWTSFLPQLAKWKALRPKSPLFLSGRTVERFERLSQAWTRCMTKEVLASDIAQVQWAQVAAFVKIVSEIKNVAAPVFTNKFCHFLAPRIFPFIDNAAMGNPFSSYEAYYQTAQSQWVKTPECRRYELTTIFAQETSNSLAPDYPVKCKIIELCPIGRHQGEKPLYRNRI